MLKLLRKMENTKLQSFVKQALFQITKFSARQAMKFWGILLTLFNI